MLVLAMLAPAGTLADFLGAMPRQPSTCALDVQRAASAAGYVGLGLPADMALRLGVHVGPGYENIAPIQRTRNFCGAHVCRVARAEPVAPLTRLHITESFVAELGARPPIQARM